jgi:hypothetical protein
MKACHFHVQFAVAKNSAERVYVGDDSVDYFNCMKRIRGAERRHGSGVRRIDIAAMGDPVSPSDDKAQLRYDCVGTSGEGGAPHLLYAYHRERRCHIIRMLKGRVGEALGDVSSGGQLDVRSGASGE